MDTILITNMSQNFILAKMDNFTVHNIFIVNLLKSLELELKSKIDISRLFKKGPYFLLNIKFIDSLKRNNNS